MSEYMKHLRTIEAFYAIYSDAPQRDIRLANGLFYFSGRLIADINLFETIFMFKGLPLDRLTDPSSLYEVVKSNNLQLARGDVNALEGGKTTSDFHIMKDSSGLSMHVPNPTLECLEEQSITTFLKKIKEVNPDVSITSDLTYRLWAGFIQKAFWFEPVDMIAAKVAEIHHSQVHPSKWCHLAEQEVAKISELNPVAFLGSSLKIAPCGKTVILQHESSRNIGDAAIDAQPFHSPKDSVSELRQQIPGVSIAAQRELEPQEEVAELRCVTPGLSDVLTQALDGVRTVAEDEDEPVRHRQALSMSPPLQTNNMQDTGSEMGTLITEGMLCIEERMRSLHIADNETYCFQPGKENNAYASKVTAGRASTGAAMLQHPSKVRDIVAVRRKHDHQTRGVRKRYRAKQIPLLAGVQTSVLAGQLGIGQHLRLPPKPYFPMAFSQKVSQNAFAATEARIMAEDHSIRQRESQMSKAGFHSPMPLRHKSPSQEDLDHPFTEIGAGVVAEDECIRQQISRVFASDFRMPESFKLRNPAQEEYNNPTDSYQEHYETRRPFRDPPDISKPRFSGYFLPSGAPRPPTPPKPSTRDLSPSPEDLSPSPEDLSPSPRDLLPSPRDLSPSTGDLSPSTGDISPSTGDLSPSTGDLSPSTGDLSPSTRDFPSPADVETGNTHTNRRKRSLEEDEMEEAHIAWPRKRARTRTREADAERSNGIRVHQARTPTREADAERSNGVEVQQERRSVWNLLPSRCVIQ